MHKTSTLAITAYPRTDSDSSHRSMTPPQSPHPDGGIGSLDGISIVDDDDTTALPKLPALPHSPASPSQRKSFLHGFRLADVTRPPRTGSETRRIPQTASTNNLTTSSAYLRPYRRSPNSSTTSLSTNGNNNLHDTASEQGANAAEDHSPAEEIATRALPKPIGISHTRSSPQSQKKVDKNVHIRNFLPLIRTQSKRGDDRSRATSKTKSRGRYLEAGVREHPHHPGPYTAPIEQEPEFRKMSSANRNISAERATMSSAEDSHAAPELLSTSRESGGVLSSIKNSSSTAAAGLGRAGRGFFGKLTRSGSGHERDVPDENYVFKVINLPLVEQTRQTRIMKRIEDAKDKTEFWMPALPYRCIDYLNWKGVEEEGLYRIPGSGREIKLWQRRFDTELDVNLMDEADAGRLYDINIVGSMLKTWLRELPDELLPKNVQTKIASECAGAKGTPQLMKDELSKLPPFNYYLLFAITCHISLLHSHSDKNKMNYHNLCVCFQPCMKIEGFCFEKLVCDWRNCWQGCWTEREYHDEERQLMEAHDPPSARPPSAGEVSAGNSAPSLADDHTNSSAPNSRPPTADRGSKSMEVYRSPPLPVVARGPLSYDNVQETSATAKIRHGRRKSTPPALSPVTGVSPMRM